MNITIVSVGKLKEKYLKQGIDEYAKRLGSYCKFQVVEVPETLSPMGWYTEAQFELPARKPPRAGAVVLPPHGYQVWKFIGMK